MELRNRTTGVVTTDSQFRAEYPNTSFPKVLTAEILNAYDYDPVLEGPQAATTAPYEISQRDGVEEIDGQWFTKYVVGPVFTDYTDDEGVVHTAAEQETAYRAQKDAEQSARIREDRTKRLVDCDWTQLADSPLDADTKAAWATYRNELRAVPEQAGFPWDVTWPEAP